MLKLNLGCGGRTIPGFINIDIQSGPGVDLVQDVRWLPYESGAVDMVYASHLLEHFSRHETPNVLREWTRVLKPGGLLRLAVPDFGAVSRRYVATRDLPEVTGLIVGGQRNHFDTHLMVFDYPTLRDLMLKAGLRDIDRWDWRMTEHHEIDDYSQAYLPHMEKSTGTLVSLNIQGRRT